MAQISAAVWMYTNSDKLESLVRFTVKTTVQSEYGSIDSRTKTFDAIQSGVRLVCLILNIDLLTILCYFSCNVVVHLVHMIGLGVIIITHRMYKLIV